MEPSARAHLRELLFRISVVLKGLDALLELVGGIALWVVSPGFMIRLVHLLTQDEIAEDPHDLVANLLRHSVSRFSFSSEHFMSIYLIAHGVVKALVVVALLRSKLWAYPAAIAVFGGFIAYQVYRFTLTGGFGLIALSVFDLVVICLIWLEYRAMKFRRSTD
jgi:uncharacterized membrane protein